MRDIFAFACRRPKSTGSKLWLVALLFSASIRVVGQVSFTEYALTFNSAPGGIAVGPDGALWFTESNSNKIGRITTAGLITEYTVPTLSSNPSSIIAGPDGALWFTEASGNNIGRITKAGAITEYPVPTFDCVPWNITAGPDGALWFTEYFGNKIGRITTAGVISEYTIPASFRAPGDIAAGPDGALWFAERLGNNIGRITTAGVITENASPIYSYGIAAGPDGALWFTANQIGQDTIGRMTTAGVVTQYPGATVTTTLGDITTGPDGALWFTEPSTNKIARITTAGVLSEYVVPTAQSTPLYIAAGPDGALWFSEESKIGRLAFSAPSVSISGLVPNRIVPASSGFALAIAGSGFQNGAAVYWNGTPLPTTYQSAAELSATVSSPLLANTGFAYVVVTNPGGASSNAYPFTITGVPEISPAPGSTLSGSAVTFNWTAVPGADYYWLDVGSVEAQGNICGLQINGTSYTCPGIMAAAGSNTLYAQLWIHSNGNWQAPYRYIYGAPAPPVATITSPVPGSTLAGSTVTFNWTAVVGADAYWLDVGTAPGQGNICGVQYVGTSYTCTGIAPATGSSAIYVQLWTHIDGSWQPPNQYVYVAPGPPAQVTSPAPGSTLTSSNVTFTWNAVAGADYYWLDVGTASGQGDICGIQVSGTSYTCSGIAPAAGSSTIHVQLWTHLDGSWEPPNRYTYGAPLATILSPAPGSALTGSTVTFTWSAVTRADYYWLDVGTTAGQGNICGIQVSGTSYNCSGIAPAAGSNTIYVQLWTHIDGNWQPPNRYTFGTVGTLAATVTSPAPGSTLSSSTVTFTWTALAGADYYWLDVGTAAGQGNICGLQVSAASYTCAGIAPAAGSTSIYVQLWTHINGSWQPPNRYTYGEPIASMTSPVPGSTLAGATVTFNWNAAAGAQAYWLDVSTVMGQGNIFGQNVGTALSKTVTGIPVNGQPIYVQLWTEIGGTWYLNRYTYTAY